MIGPPVLIGESGVATELLVNSTSRDEYVNAGSMSLTVISIVLEISPAELFPQTVKVTVAVTAVGVPVIAPVALSNSMPAGKSSYESIDHEVGAPSVYVGAAALTILFLVNVYGEPGYEIEDGASS